MSTNVGLNRAARMAGKAKTTLLRHIAAGKLSATADDQGRKRFDVAELERVYGRLATGEKPNDTVAKPMKPKGSGSDPGDQADTVAVVTVVTVLEDTVKRLEAEVVRLKADLEKANAKADLWSERFYKQSESILRLEGPEKPPGAPTTTGTGQWLADEVRSFVGLFRAR